MTILVTGGAGFIGSHLVRKLRNDGHHIAVIDDLSGGYIENLPQGIDFYRNDLRHTPSTLWLLNKIKPDIVYHLAANAAENKAQFSPIDITSRNLQPFFNVLTGFIQTKGRRFVFTSSAAVYGNNIPPFLESETPEPEDLYGVSKYSCEQALKIMAKVHGFEYVIARPHNVYGPYQNMRDPYRNVVTIFMNTLLKGEAPTIYGDGSMKRCFSYVDDVVDVLYQCGVDIRPTLSGQTLNVGSDHVYSLKELYQTICKVSDYILEPKYLPQRPQEVTEAIPDHTLSRAFFRWKETSLKEGIRRTWNWVKLMGYQEPIFTDLEIDSPKVPENWRKHD